MTILPQTEIFDAARKAHFAVTLHEAADFEGMRRAGRLAAEALDLLGGTHARVIGSVVAEAGEERVRIANAETAWAP